MDCTLWPTPVYTAFDSANRVGPASDKAYYEPYTQILLHLFTGHTDQPLNISPQRRITTHDDGSVNSSAGSNASTSLEPHKVETMPFIVQHQGHPLLFLRVRNSLMLPAFNHEADQEMREFFRKMAPKVATRRLHGICAYGTRLAFYEYDVETGIVNPPASITCPAPGQQASPNNLWLYYDVLKPAGIARLRSVVRDVYEMRQGLQKRR